MVEEVLNIEKHRRYNFVYVTKNLANGKKYIGEHSTNNLNDGYLGSGKLLRAAIRKYGLDSFKVIHRFFFDSIESAFNFEKRIVTENIVINNNYYNVSCGGRGGNHFEYTEIIRQKISLANSGKNNPMFGKPSFGMLGKKHTAESKNKISISKKNIRISDIHKKNISKFQKGRLKNNEHKLNISKAKLGKPQEIVTCPVCNKSGGISNMKRWHFDNCKFIERDA
jgi:hypothetical protein